MQNTLSRQNSILLNQNYNNPKTSLLTFQFNPEDTSDTKQRLIQGAISHHDIDGGDLYLIDDFFSEEEKLALRQFSSSTTYSKFSYGSSDAIERGEKPASAMDNKERWKFFANPPMPLKKIYQLLSMFSNQFSIEITTIPWELCDTKASSPAVIANYLEEKFSRK